MKTQTSLSTANNRTTVKVSEIMFFSPSFWCLMWILTDTLTCLCMILSMISLLHKEVSIDVRHHSVFEILFPSFCNVIPPTFYACFRSTHCIGLEYNILLDINLWQVTISRLPLVHLNKMLSYFSNLLIEHMYKYKKSPIQVRF